MRVLLVEDDPSTAKSIELMLSHANLNVYTTDLGEEGIDLAKLYDYDLILLDINLPDMNGHEVLRQLRLSWIEKPILILSGEDGTESKLKGFGFGADDYMTKPFHRKNWWPVFMQSFADPRGMRSPSSKQASWLVISTPKPLRLKVAPCI